MYASTGSRFRCQPDQVEDFIEFCTGSVVKGAMRVRMPHCELKWEMPNRKEGMVNGKD